ncbi:hypothetical protein G6F68_020734 [Rhizopus microsporus]|nr:hypothetical protein G6F68_020734 [Rhizopus microsporus]
MENPPSTGISTPVIQDAASEHAKQTAAAISLPEPTRPSGWKCAPTASAAAREPPDNCSTDGDHVQAGDTASTRTPAGASSTAKFLVICSSAALDAGYSAHAAPRTA